MNSENENAQKRSFAEGYYSTMGEKPELVVNELDENYLFRWRSDTTWSEAHSPGCNTKPSGLYQERSSAFR